MELGQADSGGRRALRVGAELVVALEENPTTGYRWSADVDESVLEITEDRNDGPVERRGAPGSRVLTFRVLRPGSFRLRLVKKRPWETAVVDEFVVDLDVSS